MAKTKCWRCHQAAVALKAKWPLSGWQRLHVLSAAKDWGIAVKGLPWRKGKVAIELAPDSKSIVVSYRAAGAWRPVVTLHRKGDIVVDTRMLIQGARQSINAVLEHRTGLAFCSTGGEPIALWENNETRVIKALRQETASSWRDTRWIITSPVVTITANEKVDGLTQWRKGQRRPAPCAVLAW